MRIVPSCVWLCLTAFSAIAIPQEPASLPFFALTNANVFDGVSNQPRRQLTVLVRDGRIVTVGATIPDGATVIDLKGRWLLPGLIDAHVHVTEASARVALKSGITTVRTGSAGINIRDKHRAGGPEPSVAVAERSKEMLPVRRAVAANAWKMGVRIAAGSDSSYDDDLGLPTELEELVRVGMSPSDAIRAATSVAAECLMIQARTGAIRAGLEADLIVVESDPTVSIRAVRQVVLVLNNGRLAVNRLQP